MADLQIPEDFCHNDVKPKGKTSHADGENFHYIWGEGRTDGAAFSNDDVKAAYEERGEEQVPLGIHGTTVAVDWDSCVAAGSCMIWLRVKVASSCAMSVSRRVDSAEVMFSAAICKLVRLDSRVLV